MQYNPNGQKPQDAKHDTQFKAYKSGTSKVATAIVAVILIISLVVLFALVAILKDRADKKALEVAMLSAEIEEKRKQTEEVESTVSPLETETHANYTADTKEITEEINSEYAILIDVTENKVVAHKNGDARIFPASMTKVMTLIVAAENIEDFNDTFTFSYKITDPVYKAGASIAGFLSSETVPLIDIMYGIALPSGADACIAIAVEVAGSEEAFVELMNEKAKELGLEGTHFTNTTGLHDDNHYSTPHEIAKIMEYAMKKPVLAEILSTYQYTTAKTEQHPEGILLKSTVFSYMKGDESEVAEVIAGKTGYTHQARRCLVTVAEAQNGHRYILTTAYGYSSTSNDHAAIFDAINIYKNYIPKPDNNV